ASEDERGAGQRPRRRGAAPARAHRRRAGPRDGHVVLGVRGRPCASPGVGRRHRERHAAHRRGPARFRRRRPRLGRAQPRRPAPDPPAGGRRCGAGRGHHGRDRGARRRPRARGGPALRDRRGTGRGVPAGPEAHDLVVRPGPRRRARRPRRGAHPRQRPAPARQQRRRAAVAWRPARRCGLRRPRLRRRLDRRPARAARPAGPSAGTGRGAHVLPRTRSAAGEPRLLRAHVGAVRRVDLAAGVPDGQPGRARHRPDADRGRPHLVRRHRPGRSRRVPRRRAARGPARPGAGRRMGDARQRDLLRAGRGRVRGPPGPRRRGPGGVGVLGHRRLRPVLELRGRRRRPPLHRDRAGDPDRPRVPPHRRHDQRGPVRRRGLLLAGRGAAARAGAGRRCGRDGPARRTAAGRADGGL
ncbi:MAG: Uncharacterized MFS-type transporter, partial [uncultured Nocardioidaceae bacterium]